MYLVTKEGEALEVKRGRQSLATQPAVVWCPKCDVSSQLIELPTGGYKPCVCGGEYFDNEHVDDALAKLRQNAALLARQAEEAADAVTALEQSMLSAGASFADAGHTLEGFGEAAEAARGASTPQELTDAEKEAAAKGPSDPPVDNTVYQCDCGAGPLKETGRKTHEKTKGHLEWLSKQTS